MKELHIADVHQGEAWKEHIKKYFDKVDKVIFHGDYFDNRQPVEKSDYKKQLKIFGEIMDLKKSNPDKVITLFGNHDNNYLYKSIFADEQYLEIHQALIDNIQYLDIGYKGVDGWVSSHAGFSKTWVNKYLKYTGQEVLDMDRLNETFHTFPWSEDMKTLRERFNTLSKDHKFIWDGLDFNKAGYDPYGDDKLQGPCWIRPASLLDDAYYPKQIVGHSPYAGEKPLIAFDGDNQLIMVDSYFHDGYCVIGDEGPTDFIEWPRDKYTTLIKYEIENAWNIVVNNIKFSLGKAEEEKKNDTIYSDDFLKRIDDTIRPAVIEQIKEEDEAQ